MAFSPDEKKLATGGHDGTIRLWDLTTLPIREAAGSPLTKFGGEVTWLRYSTDGHWLLAWNAGSKEFHVLDAATGSPRKSVPSFVVDRSDLALSPDGQTLLAAIPGGQGALDCYSVKSGQKMTLPVQKSLRESLNAIDYSPDGLYLATADQTNEISVWKMATGRHSELWPCRVLERGKGKGMDNVLVLRFSPDGKRLAIGSALGRLELIDIEQGIVTGSYAAHARLTGLAFSPDGKRLATTGLDGAVRIWDPEHMDKPIDYLLPGPVRSPLFAKDGRHLFIANADGTVFILRLPPVR
jgi:WD40 repeat protein